MKKTMVISAIFFIVIFAGGIIKDQIIKSAITVIATQATGAPVHIDGFSLGVFSQSVRISGLKVYNPKGFPKAILVDLPNINVRYDLGALLKKKLHLLNVRVEIKEIGLEKNNEGKLNVDELRVVKQGREKAGKPSEQMPMQIDMLTLSMGRIVSKDYSSGREPIVKVYDINIGKSYKNITSVQQLAALILAEPMKAAGIQGAEIYGVAMLSGVAVLPVAVAVTLIGRDSAQQDFISTFDNVYRRSLEVLKRKGNLTREDKLRGVISATINSTQITVKIKKKTGSKTQVIISARKYLLPKPEIAGGVLYEISEKLK
ncbi:MAG: AsmA family protein [Candidatus Omnitrophica bacterium]|nr:AsmA family protein [Candidatus Omnitrophota bacterium]